MDAATYTWFEPGSELPNLALYGAVDHGALAGGQLDGFDGYDPILPGTEGYSDPLLLCTGNSHTCPNCPNQALDGVVHTCEGILGTHSNGELVWIECEAITVVDDSYLDV
ncbi:hypothetical protein ACFQ78_28275 [Streptomyces sp. NPDC056519]|uniref:hypothetical protein n=1 Tax=Streptomyces sp. NPDC056519 TaxID=3345849 RepID=UPI0036BEC318